MKKMLYFILGLLTVFLGVLLYSRFIGTTGLVTNEIPISSDIYESYKGLKILHFSDLHYKKVITEKRVEELVDEINRNKPDLVLFTGDLIDSDYKITNQDINFLVKELSKVKTKYGFYAVMGDQDYSDLDVVKNIYLQSNVTLLRDEVTYIYNENNDQIALIGLNSYLKGTNISETTLKVKKDVSYQIAMVHEPDAIYDIFKQDEQIQFVVAGHSIGGSIRLPLIQKLLLPKGAKEYRAKDFKGRNVYVSNGIGVNSVNFRLWNSPSVNLYRFS